MADKEYIERRELLRKMSLEANRSTLGEFSPPHLSYGEMITLVKETPTADVKPIVYARWENVLEEELYCPDIKATIARTAQTCSRCKTRIGFIGPKPYLFDAFCPSCSAIMDKEREI